MVFTGIIYNVARVVSWAKCVDRSIWKLVLAFQLPEFLLGSRVGDSVAVDGCCLTIVTMNRECTEASFELMQETLMRTRFQASLCVGDPVHVERALDTTRSRLDGHIVQGHVSGVVMVSSCKTLLDGSVRMTFVLERADQVLANKGSVALDGVSLTVCDLTLTSFAVCLLPETLNRTHLSMMTTCCNIEFDSGLKIPLNFLVRSLSPMDHAKRLAKLGAITAPPNPCVGCVVVGNGGVIISEGYHKGPGTLHAERVALDKLTREDLLDATVYCTLEPCGPIKPGGRTPPCAPYLAEKGVRRLVVGILDPDVRTRGKGVEFLRSKGIDVVVQESVSIKRTLRAYIQHRSLNRPYVILKLAVSLDGKAYDGSNNNSKWISGEKARLDVHQLRHKCQAILVGTHTALVDLPMLTVRLASSTNSTTISTSSNSTTSNTSNTTSNTTISTSKRYNSESDSIKSIKCSDSSNSNSNSSKNTSNSSDTSTNITQPLRCFLDARNQVKRGSLITDAHKIPTLAITNKQRNDNIPSLVCNCDSNGHFDMKEVLHKLAVEKNILRLLVEGGPALASTLLDQDLVDELILYNSTSVLLGKTGVSWYTGSQNNLATARNRFQLRKTKVLEGGDVKIVLIRNAI